MRSAELREAGGCNWGGVTMMADNRPIAEGVFNTSTSQNAIPGSASGHLALVPTWLPLEVMPSSSAGSGGDGIAIGVISSTPMAIFAPSNAAIAGPHAVVEAQQGNNSLMYQHSTEMAGMGGNGGSGNASLSGGGGDTLHHAGSGGNGIFYGGMVSADVGSFVPVNVAVAGGPGSHAIADQSNNSAMLQGTTQMGGIGGSGGDHNTTIHDSPGGSGTALTYSGDLYAGHGGNGYFIGSMIDLNVAIFSPINIAVGAAGGSAEAHQTNNAIFDQGAVQIAGIGGNGGGFNLSSDTIFTGNHSSGSGGSGFSNGSMVDVNIGYFHPINIAVPAGGTADAQQLDHVLYDQHALQMAGIGGHGGDISHAHSALVDDILSFIHV